MEKLNNAPRVLLLQPQYQDSYRVLEIIRSAVRAELPEAIVETVNNLQDVYEPFPYIVIEAVSKADLIIGNMEGGNQSVTFGLGAALSREKPVLMVVPAGRAFQVPVELLNYRLFVFSIDDPENFVESFKYQVKDAFSQNKGIRSSSQENSVFISYSHTDAEFLQRLLVHLRPLDRAGLVNIWVDTHLRAGDLWEKEIAEALERSRAAILLVSADFMASDFIIENELPPLLAKAEEEGTRIIPLIVKPCRFTRDKNLARFQAINEPRKSLISLTEGEKEEVYDRVAMAVEAMLGT